MAHPPANQYAPPAHDAAPAPAAPAAGHEESHGVGHVVSPKILIATAAALLVLTVITVSAASVDFSKVDLEELNIWVALSIAAVKASLVCLFFMHLRWDRPFNAFVLASSLAFVVLFISFAMTDTGEYQEEVIPGNAPQVTTKLTELPAPPPAPPTNAGPAPAIRH